MVDWSTKLVRLVVDFIVSLQHPKLPSHDLHCDANGDLQSFATLPSTSRPKVSHAKP